MPSDLEDLAAHTIFSAATLRFQGSKIKATVSEGAFYLRFRLPVCPGSLVSRFEDASVETGPPIGVEKGVWRTLRADLT